MPSQVKVDFIGDPSQLFRVADSITAKFGGTSGQIFNFNASKITENIVAPVRRASTEVEAINRQTAQNAQRNAKFLETINKRRIDAEIADERRLDRERKATINNTLQLRRPVTASPASNVSVLPTGGVSGLGNAIGLAATTVGLNQIIGLTQTALDKSIAYERANRLLASSATEAGLSFDVAAKKNKAFAESLGLSATAAAATTAKILQLASNTGNTDQIDKLLKSFADLGAAKGIDPNDLQQLIGTILSGQDEGLNRLGIADPGRLYKEYAASVGRTVESLTQMEKVQAAVNAVMDKSQIFSGAAEIRMGSLEGTVAKTSAQWDNFTTSISNAAAGSVEMSNLLTTLSGLVRTLGTDLDEVRSKLAQGLTPKQIAEEQASGIGTRAFDATKDVLLGGPAAILAGIDLVTDGYDAAAKRFGASVGGANQRRIDELERQITKTAELDKIQARSAQNEKAERDQLLKLQERQNRALEKQKTISDLFKNPDTSITDIVNKLDFLKAQQKSRTDSGTVDGGIFGVQISDKGLKELIKQGEEAVKKSIEQGKKLAEESRKQFLSVFDSLADLQATDNPLARVYLQADRALETLRKNTTGLSDELREVAENIQIDQNLLARFNARAENVLNVSDLRQQAQFFRSGRRDEDEGVFAKRVSKRLEDAGLYDDVFQKVKQLPVEEQARFLGLDRLKGNEESTQARLDRQFKELGHLSPGDELQRAAFDRRITSLAGSVDPTSLRDDTRNAVADALERQADRAAAQEAQAQKLLQDHIAVSEQINANVVRLIGVAQKSGLAGVEGALKITVNDETASGVSTKQTPKRPNAQDTADLYGGLDDFFGARP